MAALLLVDIQVDFLPGGALAIPHGDEVLPIAYRLLDSAPWTTVIASQDYHPPGHVSFASSHKGRHPFTSIFIPSFSAPSSSSSSSLIKQELWPDHCIASTPGAELDQGIQNRLEKKFGGGEVLRKGTDMKKDAYSAFAIPLTQKDQHTPLLTVHLVERTQIKNLFIMGLATDFCVRATVLSALEESEGRWKTWIVREGCRGVDAERSEKVLDELERMGAKVVSVQEVEEMGLLGQLGELSVRA